MGSIPVANTAKDTEVPVRTTKIYRKQCGEPNRHNIHRREAAQRKVQRREVQVRGTEAY